MRKVQIYLSEHQYRLLKQRAGDTGSIAAEVRQLIDGSTRPGDALQDPFYKHLMSKKKGSDKPYDAGQAKRDLYEHPR
ncbi:MAG: hypothetical protein ABIS18_01300 [Actinomycetota bacterium]